MSVPLASLGDRFEFRDQAFNAANFTGSGSITWTLTSPDQQYYRIAVRDRVAFIEISLRNTTVAGAGSELYIAMPFDTTGELFMVRRCLNNAVWDDVIVGISGTRIVLYEKTGGNWGAGANTTSFWLDLKVPLAV